MATYVRPPKPNQSALTSAAAASVAFLAPLVMSASSVPSPNHPRILAWYWSLRKPRFKPKDWVIPLAWFGIESALATAGYRLLQSDSSASRSKALAWWGFNIFMIGAWSRLFFKHRALAASTVAATAMIVSGAEFVRHAKRVDQTAARAGVPFVAWVSFATILTATIWALNRKRS